MSRLINGLKVQYSFDSKCQFFLPDTLKGTGFTISTPKSYDEHSRQVKYGSLFPPSPRARNLCFRKTHIPVITQEIVVRVILQEPRFLSFSSLLPEIFEYCTRSDLGKQIYSWTNSTSGCNSLSGCPSLTSSEAKSRLKA